MQFEDAEDWQILEDWDYEKLRNWFINEGFSNSEITYSGSLVSSLFYIDIGKMSYAFLLMKNQFELIPQILENLFLMLNFIFLSR